MARSFAFTIKIDLYPFDVSLLRMIPGVHTRSSIINPRSDFETTFLCGWGLIARFILRGLRLQLI